MKKIAVVGGGITGLTAAFHLQQAGFHPLLFDAAPATGGVIRTTRENGYLCEAGPNTIQENSPEIRDLLQALHLENEVVEANPAAKKRYIVRDGKPVPIPSSPLAFLRSPLLSGSAKLRLLKEPYIAHAPRGEDESVASFTRRRLGPEVLDYLVDPFVSGIFAGDPERLSLEHAFPRIHGIETEHGSIFRAMVAAARNRKRGENRKTRLLSFRDGLSALPAKLTERLAKHIYHDAPVQSIQPENGGWQLIASRYDHRLRDRYDAIVLALPPDALAALKIENTASPNPLEILREIPRPPVVSVSLGFRRDQITHPLDGFGMLFPAKEKAGILGVLFPSTLFPNRAPENHVLLTVFAGGRRQPEVANLSDAQLLPHILTDLRPLLGISEKPAFAKIHRWPYAIPQYEIGFGRFKETIDRFETENPGLFIAGTSRDGVALGQCIASGIRHAARAIEYLKNPPEAN